MSESPRHAPTVNHADSTSRERPLPAAMTVREARDAYLAENGFDTATYTEDTVTLMAFGRYWSFPNRPNRKWAIPLHDLHHVATGYGSDLVGEAEIGAWELGAGCRTPVVYVLNLVASLIGLVLAPRRIARAFASGLRSRTLYREPQDYEARLERDLGSLREQLGLPRDGLAQHPRGLHEAAPLPACEPRV